MQKLRRKEGGGAAAANGGDADEAGAATPKPVGRKRGPAAGKKTPAKRKGKNAETKAEDDSDDEMKNSTPSKKVKTEVRDNMNPLAGEDE